ncbi:hypothetical protein EJ02DRAFT_466332 [Clathrospora elynae]|uniref:Uncharacterized protein n=1 Tax=Clathrospora elynae TaxID=706981 RepID=A0A6A5SPU1_9PLEO|nr:hypothetical protein EJ02DRAFT_466332 [Clathrospora elynae]
MEGPLYMPNWGDVSKYELLAVIKSLNVQLADSKNPFDGIASAVLELTGLLLPVFTNAEENIAANTSPIDKSTPKFRASLAQHPLYLTDPILDDHEDMDGLLSQPNGLFALPIIFCFTYSSEPPKDEWSPFHAQGNVKGLLLRLLYNDASSERMGLATRLICASGQQTRVSYWQLGYHSIKFLP